MIVVPQVVPMVANLMTSCNFNNHNMVVIMVVKVVVNVVVIVVVNVVVITTTLVAINTVIEMGLYYYDIIYIFKYWDSQIMIDSYFLILSCYFIDGMSCHIHQSHLSLTGLSSWLGVPFLGSLGVV